MLESSIMASFRSLSLWGLLLPLTTPSGEYGADVARATELVLIALRLLISAVVVPLPDPL